MTTPHYLNSSSSLHSGPLAIRIHPTTTIDPECHNPLAIYLTTHGAEQLGTSQSSFDHQETNDSSQMSRSSAVPRQKVVNTLARVTGSPKSLQCWDHGCNGVELFTRGQLLQHQREKAGNHFNCHWFETGFSKESDRDEYQTYCRKLEDSIWLDILISMREAQARDLHEDESSRVQGVIEEHQRYRDADEIGERKSITSLACEKAGRSGVCSFAYAVPRASDEQDYAITLELRAQESERPDFGVSMKVVCVSCRSESVLKTFDIDLRLPLRVWPTPGPMSGQPLGSPAQLIGLVFTFVLILGTLSISRRWIHQRDLTFGITDMQRLKLFRNTSETRNQKEAKAPAHTDARVRDEPAHTHHAKDRVVVDNREGDISSASQDTFNTLSSSESPYDSNEKSFESRLPRLTSKRLSNAAEPIKAVLHVPHTDVMRANKHATETPKDLEQDPQELTGRQLEGPDSRGKPVRETSRPRAAQKSEASRTIVNPPTKEHDPPGLVFELDTEQPSIETVEGSKNMNVILPFENMQIDKTENEANPSVHASSESLSFDSDDIEDLSCKKVDITQSGESPRSAALRTAVGTRKRTKTGCLTCRKRRIKCGEERPLCKNCVRSRRDCEGYYPRTILKDPLISFRPVQRGDAGFPPQAFAYNLTKNVHGRLLVDREKTPIASGLLKKKDLVDKDRKTSSLPHSWTAVDTFLAGKGTRKVVSGTDNVEISTITQKSPPNKSLSDTKLSSESLASAVVRGPNAELQQAEVGTARQESPVDIGLQARRYDTVGQNFGVDSREIKPLDQVEIEMIDCNVTDQTVYSRKAEDADSTVIQKLMSSPSHKAAGALEDREARLEGLELRSALVPVTLDRNIDNSAGLLPHGISIMGGQEFNTTNRLKGYVEDWTKQTWDWWPFRPRFRRLNTCDVRIQWLCESGHPHWTEVSKIKAEALQMTNILPIAQVNASGCSAPTSPDTAAPRDSDSDLSSDTDRHSRGESPTSRTSSATSDTGSSDDPDEEAGAERHRERKAKEPTNDKAVAVDIVLPSTLKGFILFGVQGAKRLRSPRTQLAQVDVEVHKDDDSFFDEIAVQYRNLRGFFRWTFSIWCFRTCEFVMYHKANPNWIMAGPEELPSVNDGDYEFNASRCPPVLESVFSTNFYGCNKACVKARLDILSMFHECSGRDHCGKYRVLERLPRRRRKWEIDRDEEKEEAWGLHVLFGISFYQVALYHLLILAGPLISWGFWLKRWPRDWQNASVPFFAVVVLLSLFWLPFAHNASSQEKTKLKIA